MLDQNIPYRPASVNPNDKQQQKELARAWQRQKENWRRTVAVRFRTWLHVAVAGELDACFNSKTGEAAFAGTRKMAKNLHIDRRNVRNAIDDLVTAEPPMLCRHLKREPGRRSKTIYLMMGALDWSKKGEDGIGGSPAPYEKTDRGFTSPPMGGSPAPYIGVHRPPLTSEGTSKVPSESTAHPPPPRGGGGSLRKEGKQDTPSEAHRTQHGKPEEQVAQEGTESRAYWLKRWLEETSERREAHEAQVAQEWKELAKTAPDSDDIQRWTKEREETRKSNEHPYANYDPNDDREDDREDDRPRVEVTRVWDVKPGVCKAVRPSTQVNNE